MPVASCWQPVRVTDRQYQRRRIAHPMQSIELIVIASHSSLAVVHMQPRLGTRPVQNTLHRQSQSHATASALGKPSPWRLTRRLTTAGRLALFRASAANGIGPGCYVLKTVRQNAADDKVGHAMLRR